MPTVKVSFAPNVIKDDSPLNAKGGIIDANLMRNRQGAWQTIKGWEEVTASLMESLMDGASRGMHAWTDLLGAKHMLIGTPNKLWYYSENGLADVTGNAAEGVLVGLNGGSPVAEDERPFKTTSGSAIVEVRHTQHGRRVGDSVTFSNATSVGGLSMNNTFTVASIVTPDKYTFTHTSNASSSATGGGNVDYVYAWRNGDEDGADGTLPTVWSIDNFGEIGLANRRGGGLYGFQPASSYPELWDATKAALGSKWTRSGNIFRKIDDGGSTVDSNLSMNVEGLMKAGYVYRITIPYTNLLVSNLLSVKMNAGDPAGVIDVGTTSTPFPAGTSGSSTPLSGTLSRLIVCPANPVDIVINAPNWLGNDSAGDGEIGPISLKLESDAFHIPEAPAMMDVMWVDAATRTVHAAGTFEADGDFNPLLVRNSAQENFREWVPDADNLADEYPLGNGSRIVGACATRQQTLIFTDDGVFSQQFTGSSGEVYSYRLLGTACGLIGKNAAREINGQVFWWSNNGNLYTFQGAIPQIIQSWRFRRDATENLAEFQNEKVYCWINSENNEVWWHYPDARDAGEGAGECSRVVAYNWIEDHSVPHMMDRTAGMSQGIFPYPILVSSSGELFYHEKGHSADGENFAPYLETAWFDIEDGETLQKVEGLIPDFDDRIGYVKFDLSGRNNPGMPVVAKPPLTYTGSQPRLLTRLFNRQAKLRIYSNQPESFWVLGALKLMIEKTGARR